MMKLFGWKTQSWMFDRILNTFLSLTRKLFSFLTFIKAPTPQNTQIVWMCLNILWGWRLKVKKSLYFRERDFILSQRDLIMTTKIITITDCCYAVSRFIWIFKKVYFILNFSIIFFLFPRIFSRWLKKKIRNNKKIIVRKFVHFHQES